MIRYQAIQFQIFYFIICMYYQQQLKAAATTLKFTKFDCEAYDKPFADFRKCYLNAIRRDTVSLSMHVRMHQIPVNNVTVNAAFFVKSSNQRYQPFMYNTTLDFCKFLRNTNSYPFWKIIYSIIKTNSNINHTCPFNHDIIVENLVLSANMIKMIPYPSGDYLIVLRVGAYNDYKAEVRVSVLIKE